MEEDLEELAISYRWAWSDYKDLERSMYFDKLKDVNPYLYEAWIAYKKAQRLVELEVYKFYDES